MLSPNTSYYVYFKDPTLCGNNVIPISEVQMVAIFFITDSNSLA